MKLVEYIQNDVLDSSPNVKWDEIAGLEFAKKTIKEIIIWPLLRPDLFGGIRRPPKVITYINFYILLGTFTIWTTWNW